MINRLYDNGILYDANPRHSGRSAYPTMPRLSRDAFESVALGGNASVTRGRAAMARITDCFNILFKAIRAF